MPRYSIPKALALLAVAAALLMLGCASQQQPSCTTTNSGAGSGYSPIIPLGPYSQNCTNTTANSTGNSTVNPAPAGTNGSMNYTASGNESNSTAMPSGQNVSMNSSNPAGEMNYSMNSSQGPSSNSSGYNESMNSTAYNSSMNPGDSGTGLNSSANVTLRVVYFYSSECPFCRDIAGFINKTSADFAPWGVALEQHNIISAPAQFALYNDFAARYNVSAGLRVIPMVYINDSFIYTNQSIREELAQYIDSCLASGSCIDPYSYRKVGQRETPA